MENMVVLYQNLPQGSLSKNYSYLQESFRKHTASSIDQIAYTAGPGLLGTTLLIGENFAQVLALALNKPLIPVNHLEGRWPLF